jgi:hypothetical protein
MKPRHELMLYVLIGLLFVWAGLLYRSAVSMFDRFGTPDRVAADGCEYQTIEWLDPRHVVIVPIGNRPTIVHPGGWHWRVECPDGTVFHVKVAHP